MQKKQKFLIKLIKAPMVTLAIGAFAFSSNALSASLKKLTSDEKAKEVSQDDSTFSRRGNPTQLHSIGIGVGQTFLKGQFSEQGEDKITWDLFYNYSASYSFDFFANFHVSDHEFRGKKAEMMGLALGIKAKVYQFDSFSPFGSAGLGFYSPKVTRQLGDQLIESDRKTTFGYHLGVGADLDLNRSVKVGFMAIYHNPFDVGQEYQAAVEGSYYKLLMTAYYNF